MLAHLVLLLAASSLAEDFAPPAGYEVVTTEGKASLGAEKTCGEDTTEGRKICVSYNLCDPKTGTIDRSGKYDGHLVIDIRVGTGSCPGYLDVCCKIPDDNGTDVTTPPPPTPTSDPRPKPSGNFCGVRNENGVDFKITGNTDNEAEYGEFPWMVAVLKASAGADEGAQQVALCGGSLIGPQVVLTGAHCVHRLQPSDVKIRAGEWDTQTTAERLPFQERNVAQIITHQDFNPDNLFNDIALLILESPLKKAEHIGTVCLPNQDQKIVSKNCFASGWGKNRFGKKELYQVILKKIELPIVEHDECERLLRTTRLGAFFQLHPSFTCAGGEPGKDACTGDGGGPLVCPDPANPARYLQVGIVAWGIGCGENNIPGVYADVAQFRDWVDAQVRRLNLRTEPYSV